MSGSRQIGDWPTSGYTFPKMRLFFVEVEGERYAIIDDSLDMAIADCEEFSGARRRRQYFGSLWPVSPDLTVRIVG